MQIAGRVQLSKPGKPRKTAGQFSNWMNVNSDVLRRYFGVDLAPGSLNVQTGASHLHEQLDACDPTPAFIIPRDELRWMPDHLGDARVWSARLSGQKIPDPHHCWLLRRKGSQVGRGVVEIVSTVRLVVTYGLDDGDLVQIVLEVDDVTSAPTPT